MEPRHTAYGLLHIKSATTAAQVFTFSGMATTPALDRQNEIIDPLGVRFRNPVPLLLHHDKTQPVGEVILGPVSATGVAFTATIPILDEPGIVKDRTDEARHSVAAGFFKAVSIGFRPLGPLVTAAQRMKDGALKILKSEVLEVSLVTIPANAEATIDGVVAAIKSFAATGEPHVPGVTGVPATRGTPMTKDTRAERIKAFEGDRDIKLARMAAIMDEPANEGATLDETQTKEYDGLGVQVEALNAQIKRERELETLLASTAQPLPPTPGRVEMPIIRVKSMLPPGTAATRVLMALVAGKGSRSDAIEWAKRWDDSTPEVGLYLKAAVAVGTSTGADWAKPLVPPPPVMNELIELVRNATLVGRIPGLRRVPFGATVAIQTAGGVYNWVGETKPKPVTKLALGSAAVGRSKIAGIFAISEELARDSSPSAEGVIRNDMVNGIARFEDAQFIDPAVAEVTGIHPASITNGVTGVAATADPLKDIHTMMMTFASKNIPLSSIALLMSETNAFVLSTKTNALGAPQFPNLGTTGGSVNGISVVTSNVRGTNIVGLVPSYILYAEDGGVQIDISREASVQLNDAPADPADATTVFTSFWQQNLVGIRAERFVSWKRTTIDAVQVITGTAYPVSVMPAVAPAP